MDCFGNMFLFDDAIKDLRTSLFFQPGENDARACWDSLFQGLTYDKPSMLIFKPREALAVIHDSYDLRFQIRPYVLNTFKKLLNEEIQKVKIAWKTSYLVT